MNLITKIRLVREDLTRARARKRMSRQPTSEVVAWAESCLSVVGRGLSQYQSYGGTEPLADAQKALLTLQGVVDELHARADRGA